MTYRIGTRRRVSDSTRTWLSSSTLVACHSPIDVGCQSRAHYYQEMGETAAPMLSAQPTTSAALRAGNPGCAAPVSTCCPRCGPPVGTVCPGANSTNTRCTTKPMLMGCNLAETRIAVCNPSACGFVHLNACATFSHVIGSYSQPGPNHPLSIILSTSFRHSILEGEVGSPVTHPCAIHPYSTHSIPCFTRMKDHPW